MKTVLAIWLAVLAFQEPHGATCRQSPGRDAKGKVIPACHCKLTEDCSVAHAPEGMSARCANDCEESRCACHIETPCEPKEGVY